MSYGDGLCVMGFLIVCRDGAVGTYHSCLCYVGTMLKCGGIFE
jgi:hypothetical protein